MQAGTPGVRQRPSRASPGAIVSCGSATRSDCAPRGGVDIIDVVLAGRTGRVEAIERDFDDEVHVAIVVDDDPGRDLGTMRQPGHRFSFRLGELEPA